MLNAKLDTYNWVLDPLDRLNFTCFVILYLHLALCLVGVIRSRVSSPNQGGRYCTGIDCTGRYVPYPRTDTYTGIETPTFCIGLNTSHIGHTDQFREISGL